MSDHEAVLFTIHPEAKILHTWPQNILISQTIQWGQSWYGQTKDIFMSGNHTLELLKTPRIFLSQLYLIASVNTFYQVSLWFNLAQLLDKNRMLHKRWLYNIAKQSDKSKNWAAYHLARNLVNSQLECAHNAYNGWLFDDSFAGNCKQFWKYIQTRCTEPSVISTLLIDNQSVSDPKRKAIAISNQF